MNLKTTYFLFGIFFVMIVAFIAVFFWGGGPPPAGPEGVVYVFPDLNEKQQKEGSDNTQPFDSIRIVRSSGDKKETLLFVRGKGGWEMKEPHPLRVTSMQVTNLAEEVAGAKRQKSDMSSNLSEYGLDSPREVITLKRGDKEWTLNVGKESAGGSVVYVSNAAKPQEPMAVRKTELDTISAPANSFRDHELLTDANNTAEVSLLDAKGQNVDLKKTADVWRFVKPPYGPANASGASATNFQPPGTLPNKKMDGVRELLNAATALRVETDEDFIAEGVSDADLAEKYGLAKDKPATLGITLKKPGEGEGKTQTLLIGKEAPPPEEKKDDKKDEKKDEAKDSKKEDKKDEKKPEPKPKYYYARLAGEDAVVRIPEAKVKPLLDVAANPDPLRSRDLISVTPPGKIDAIDVQAGGDTIKLRLSGTKWTMYHNGPHATDADTIRDMIEAITGSNSFTQDKHGVVKLFVDKDEGIHFDKADRVVSLWVNGLKRDEKKEGEKPGETKKDDKEPELVNPDKPTVKLTFVNQKDLLYVERKAADGDKSVVTVADTMLDKIPGEMLAYFDRKLPTFASVSFEAPKDASKVALYQDVKVDDKAKPKWEVTREKDGDKMQWKLTQPTPVRNADADAVANIVRGMAGLQAVKIANEKPGDLGGYGLATPKFTVVISVKKDDKTEDWIYTFGDEKKYTDKKPGEKPDTTVKEEKTGVFAKVNKSDMVFLVAKETVDKLRSAELRDLTVFRFDPAKVKGVKVVGWATLDNPVTLEFERKDEKEWTVKSPAGKTADATAIGYFLDRLRDLRADRFVNPTADPGLDTNKGALRAELTVEGEKDPLVLTLGKEDPDNKDFYFAKASTQGEQIFLLRKGNFEKVKPDPKYFLKQ